MKYGSIWICAGTALLALGLPGGAAWGRTMDARPHAAVCPDRAAGTFNCTAHVVVDEHGAPAQVRPAQGKLRNGATLPYGPAQFLKAYNLTGQALSGHPIIAIVDAFDNPGVRTDLTAYSKFYGIPDLPDCGVPIAQSPTACFQKVDQRGGANYPPVDTGWMLEIDLDVEIAHAICQNCSILLVESDTNTYDSMMAAVSEAVSLGAAVVSNSWSSAEWDGENLYDPYVAYPGVAMLFASGDSGYGPQYPAASPYVTAVGGTTLYLYSDGSYMAETAWGGTGSGCSVYEVKPPWQKDTGCPNRTIGDVAAVANPSTGAAVYSSQYAPCPYSSPYYNNNCWYQVGGTSLATPLLAGVYALSGNLPPNVWANSMPYLKPTSLRDVASGSNGSCGQKNTATYYLCDAMPGYDGPTGLGSPNGTGGF